MTQDQIKGFARWALTLMGGLVGGFIIAHGGDQGQVTKVIGDGVNAVVDAIPTITALFGALAPIATAVWTALRHTEAGNAKAAVAPGVTVTVNPRVASPAVVAVARDPDVPGVGIAGPNIGSPVPPGAQA